MKEEKLYFWPSCFCVVEDDIWFVYGKICLLCKYNIKKKETIIVSDIPVDDIFGKSLFKNMIYKDEKIYLIPAWAKNILVFDIRKNTFDEIDIPVHEGLMFCKAYLYKGEIVCIPYTYPAIVRIDTAMGIIKKGIDLKEIKKEYDISYFNDADKRKSEIIMVSPQSKEIFIYDMESNVIDTKLINKGEGNYTSIACLKDEIAIISDNHTYVSFCNSKFEIEKKIEIPRGRNNVSLWSTKEGTLVIDDITSSMICILDQEGSLSETNMKLFGNRNYYSEYYDGIFDRESGMYFDNCNAEFCRDFLKKEYFKIEITKEIMEFITSIVAKSNPKMYEEDAYYGLDSFVESILFE